MTTLQSPDNGSDSQTLLNQIVIEYMREKRRKKYWRWVKRFIVAILFLWIIYQFLAYRTEELTSRTKPHVGLIELKGEIFDNHPASADNFIKGLDKAYDNTEMKAIIVRIDSPGGSPVQADYMYNTLQYYRSKYPKIKIYAVCVDICASAAYYIAAGAEHIYADPNSMVGSIGVLYNGFGFVDAMNKIGVSRRLMIAGHNKGFLDPFSPVDDAQEKKLQVMLDLVHQQFIDKVKEGRGDRLHINDDTFSGLIWTGTQAKEQGLIDGFASSGQLAREIIKIDNIVDYTYEQSVLERVSKNIGTALADELPLAMGMRQSIQ